MATVKALVIWWGGWGWWHSPSGTIWWGGWGGGYQYNASLSVSAQAYTVTVGEWWAAPTSNIWWTWWNSVFSTITANGGGWWGTSNVAASNGWSGWWAGSATSATHWTGNQWYDWWHWRDWSGGGWSNDPYATWWWWGSGAVWADATINGSWAGWVGTSNSITGSAVYYAWWWWGWADDLRKDNSFWAWGNGWWGNGGGNSAPVAWTDWLGGWGGWGTNGTSPASWAKGGKWVVIISYKTDGSDGVDTSSTWWTVTTSWEYTIHTFTSSGTWTMVDYVAKSNASFLLNFI